VISGLKLLDTVLAAGVKHFIFSSSAVVYGEPALTPIDEKQVLMPTNL